MMLDDVLARLNDETAAAELILGLGDLPLLAAMRQQADAEGIDLATYARDAVQRYAVQASDEEWVTLMGLIGRAADPGLACLKRAFENALRGCLISSPNAVSKIAENEKPATAGLEWWAL